MAAVDAPAADAEIQPSLPGVAGCPSPKGSWPFEEPPELSKKECTKQEEFGKEELGKEAAERDLEAGDHVSQSSSARRRKSSPSEPEPIPPPPWLDGEPSPPEDSHPSPLPLEREERADAGEDSEVPNPEFVVAVGPDQRGAEAAESAEAVEAQPSSSALVRDFSRRVSGSLESLRQNMPKPPTSRCPSLPRCDCYERLSRIHYLVCEKMGHYPWAFVIFYTIILVVAISAAWRRVVINTDLDAFRRVDATAAMHHDVYLEALKSVRAAKNATDLIDRTVFKLEVFYEASGSVLEEAELRQIRGFEHRLKALPGWQRLCNMSDPAAKFRCEPGASLGNYIWPRRLDAFLTDEGIIRLAFDGSARERMPVGATLTYLAEQVATSHDPWKFLPAGLDMQHADSAMLRSLFVFTAPSLEDAAYRQEYNEFVENELYPMLLEEVRTSRRETDPDSWDEPSHIHISFCGDVMDEFELRRVLEDDSRNAGGALVFTALVCWFQFRSFFLAIAATLLLSMTVLLTYVVVPLPKVGLASFLAIFLIYGLGSHSLFRLHGLWRRSRTKPFNLGWTERLLAIHSRAALQLSPLVMSSLSFYVCLYALLRPLREFGLFMGAGMLFTCLVSFLVFIPLLVLHEETVRPLIEQHLPWWLAMALEPSKLRPPWRVLAAVLSEVAKKPKPLLAGTAVLFFITFLATLVVALTRDSTGLPELFPPSHLHNAGRTLATHFTPMRLTEVEPPPSTTTFCEPGRNLTDCGLHWCDAPVGPQAGAEEACTCHRTGSAQEEAGCANLTVSAYFSGRSFAALSNGNRSALHEAFVLSQWGNFETPEFAVNDGAFPLPSLVLEDWESGITDIEPLFSMPTTTMTRNGSRECNSTAICHCGARVCQAPGLAGYSETPITIQRPPSMPLGAPDQDQGFTIQGSSGEPGTEVIVIFGILPPESSEFLDGGTAEWSFDQTFDPMSPWVQRAMYAACSDLPAELNVVETQCWIARFRTWLLNRGEQFPVKRFDDFHEKVRRYIAEDRMAAADMWLDENGNIRAMASHFKVGRRSSSSEVLEDQRAWRAFIDVKNSEAVSIANKAWVTSQAWVEMEAYDEASASAWRVSLLIILAVIVSGLVYTMDFEIMGCLVLIVIVASAVLLFFMLCIFQFQFGPWQLVLMTLFLSYSIEPAMQLGRSFVLPSAPAATTEPAAASASSAWEQPALTNSGEEKKEAVEGGWTAGSTFAKDGEQVVDTTGTLLGVTDATGAGGKEPTPSMPTDVDSEASNGGTEGQDPASALEHAVNVACDTVVASSVQLIVCGIMLLPCKFRLFTQLGAVAMLIPFVWVPGTLLLLPAVILFSGRTRREPDAWLLWRHFEQQVAIALS